MAKLVTEFAALGKARATHVRGQDPLLTKKHIFGSYDNIGHDVWHAAYGVYCPTLDSQKTVQYDWLLQQSLDGSPFVDPRNPNAGGSGAGGTGGMAAGGAAGSFGNAGTATGGTAPAGSGGTSVLPSAGSSSAGTAGSATAGTGSSFTPGAADANDSGGCSMAPAPSSKSAGAWLLLAALGAVTRRRRAPALRGGAPRALAP